MHSAFLPLSWSLIGLLFFALPASVGAETTVPQHRLSYSNLTVVRDNPEGLQDDFKLDYRYALFRDNPGLLFQECEVLAGTTTYLTPAFVKMGGRVGIRPLAVLYLEGRMDYVSAFGVLGHVQGFPDATADASDEAREALKEAGAEKQTTGVMTTLTTQLRAKVGDVAIRSTGSMIHANMELNEGDTVWYEGVNDLLMPAKGWALHLDNDLLWLLGDGWVLGARHSMDQVFYPNTENLDADLLAEKTPNHRVGPLVAYSFFDEPGATFNKPTVVLIVNWHLRHPYRAGQETHQARPYGLLAFAFSGDFLKSDD